MNFRVRIRAYRFEPVVKEYVIQGDFIVSVSPQKPQTPGWQIVVSPPPNSSDRIRIIPRPLLFATASPKFHASCTTAQYNHRRDLPRPPRMDGGCYVRERSVSVKKTNFLPSMVSFENICEDQSPKRDLRRITFISFMARQKMDSSPLPLQQYCCRQKPSHTGSTAPALQRRNTRVVHLMMMAAQGRTFKRVWVVICQKEGGRDPQSQLHTQLLSLPTS